jgi:adenylylsulfate kinase-like enzyme
LYDFIEQGKTKNLPGIDLEYEIPANAKINFKPEENELNIVKLLDYLAANKIFPNH